MGTWGYEIFENDSALNFIVDMKSSNNIELLLKESIETAFNSEYLENDECNAIIVSAAFIDFVINHNEYPNEDFKLIINYDAKFSLTELRSIAIKGLKIVLGNKSELNELWIENKELYPKWRDTIIDLNNRLQNNA